jgi:MYXO-CTERM domain-containing protein
MTLGARGRPLGTRGVLLIGSLLLSGCGRTDGTPSDAFGTTNKGATTAGGERISERAQAQMAALLSEKATRPPALHKVDSQLVYALKAKRGEAIAPGITELETNVTIDADGRVVVEIDVREVSPVLTLVPTLGGEVLGSYPKFGGVTARVPLSAIERLGAEPAVKFVREFKEPLLNRETVRGAVPLGKPSEVEGTPAEQKPGGAEARGEIPGSVDGQRGPMANASGVGTDLVNTSPGVTVHRADVAQRAFGANGQGIQVGVLSDSARYLASVQALGDLPSVTVLPGQEGPLGTGEGTAMLELVHDMAPSSELYFATAFTGVAAFATNILSLRSAGCDVIVDDVFYLSESPFQDGPIAQAVNTVVGDGAVYLSSAGNAGSLLKSTAGVFEGDFVDSGASIALLSGLGVINLFAGSLPYDEVIATNGASAYTLFWSDPLGTSANDYDLFVLDSTLSTVVASSTNVQAGAQDPFEQATPTPAVGQRLVVVKKVGAQDRFLHLNGNRHRLALSTTGQTKGHSAAAGAFSVAATPAGTAIGTGSPSGPFPGVFTASNVLENYSSDGSRRIYYDADGSLANTSNSSLLADGGVVRQKPDVAAADGVATATPGFSLFYGTSASAPHAAGIVAQMLSVAPAATGAQIRAALTATTIDIEGAGTDINAGAGIVMADSAVSALLSAPALSLGTVTPTPANGADAVLDPGESATLAIQLRNTSSVAATAIVSTLSSTSPEVTITQASSPYPDIAVNGSGLNGTAFGIRVASTALCGAALDFTLTVTTSGVEQAFDFELLTGSTGGAPLTFAYSGAVTAIPDGTGAEAPGMPATATISVPAQTAAIGSLVFRLDGTASSTVPGATTVGLDHTFVGDLSLSLTSPSGTTVPLVARMNDYAGNQTGNNFYDTVFDDAGMTSINVAATAPFTGTFRPVGTLASFAGEDPEGVWTLTARDFFDVDTGSIRAFSIVVAPRQCTVLDNQGAACTLDSECSTGQCVDGVCCDLPCGGNNPTDCQACDSTGTCGAAPASTVCRAAANECDQEETCDGTSACPSDGARVAGTTCGAAPSGLCDVPDTCSGGTGATATCLSNVAMAGTSCRASAGACDIAEACTGLSAECPVDTFVQAGTQCRASAGVCDVAEACAGNAAACPPNAFVASGTVCRLPAGECDVAEACTGNTAPCPVDGFAPEGSVCTDANACTSGDLCSSSGSCTPGAGVTCDDDNECTHDSCFPATGCSYRTRSGELCADGSGICDGRTCQLEPGGEGGAGVTPGGGSGGMSGGSNAGSTATGGSAPNGGTSSTTGGSAPNGGTSSATGGSAPNGGTSSTTGGTSSQVGGDAGDAGAAGAAGEAGEGGEGAVIKPPKPPVSTRTGCKCEVGTEGDATHQACLALLAVAAVALRRRGRRAEDAAH